MSTRTPSNVFDSTIGRGSTSPLVTLFWDRAPTGNDINYSQGQRVIFNNPALTATITGIANSGSGGPTVVTATNFFTPGMIVNISGVGGMTQINGGYYNVIDSTSSSFTISLDSSSFGAYTSGGIAVANKSIEYILEGTTPLNGVIQADWTLLATEPELDLFLQGNTGSPAPPNGLGIIYTVGDGTTINSVSNSATNTVTFSASGTGVTSTLTPNSGGAVSPTAGNINVFGIGSLTTVNSGSSTLSVELTGLTNNAILLGQGTTTIGLLGPTNNATLATTAAGIPQLLSMAADGDLLIGSSAGAPVVGTLTAGTGISIVNGHNSITIASTGSSAVWTDKATGFTAVSGNGYFITGALTALLPASPLQGDVIQFAVDTASALVIGANTGHFIRVGAAISSSGGTLTNSARGDSIVLVYRSSDTTWISVGAPQGVWATA